MSETEHPPRFDVRSDGDGWSIDYHFCREWDDTGGCYGTNPDHGFSFDEAKAYVVERLRERAAYWENLTLDKWMNP